MLNRLRLTAQRSSISAAFMSTSPSASAASSAIKRLSSRSPSPSSNQSKKIKMDNPVVTPAVVSSSITAASPSATASSSVNTQARAGSPSTGFPALQQKNILLDSVAAVATAETVKPTSSDIRGKAIGGRKQQQSSKRKAKPPKPGGAEETSHFDTLRFLGSERVQELRALEEVHGDGKKAAEVEWGVGAEGKDVEVTIVGLSSHGDGLALITPSSATAPTRLLTVPFTLPSEICLVHIHRHEPDTLVSHADLVSIITSSDARKLQPGEVVTRLGAEGRGAAPSEKLIEVRKKFGERVQCQYFGVCSGCQYQPLSYASQLTLKQTVVENAFKNFSLLPLSAIPAISATLPSPLEYGYRTKLTPHFQAPPPSGKSGGKDRQQRGRKGKGKETNAVLAEDTNEVAEKEWEVTIGFEQKGRKRVIDIEECVIATQVINDALVHERAKVKAQISSYQRGATILLRDSLPPRAPGAIKSTSTPIDEAHVCITDHHATVREHVGNVEFEQIAGSFFQNNSSILPSLLEYVAAALRPPPSSSISSPSATIPASTPDDSKRYLIDAYCGSGLFAIGLADQFDEISGVEIDKKSVLWARKNAAWNADEGRGNVEFRDGKAEAIFDSIKFPSHRTTILLDPPRKGCDDLFLTQLLAFNPSTIVYVSCNVHTQARDIGWLIMESQKRANAEVEGATSKGVFYIESLRAADLFANTHHAEGVAVLRRR